VAGGATIYDEVVYPNRPSTRTTPARLAVAPALFGLDHAPPERCRVLEIGGGDGGNLIPMAAASPGAEFVGFDLAPARVAAGREVIAALGLANIRLEALDILDAGDLGRFDYVVAHGVYSGCRRRCGRRCSRSSAAAWPRAASPMSITTRSPAAPFARRCTACSSCTWRGWTTPGRGSPRALRFLRLIAEGAAEAQPLQQALRAEAAALLKRPPHVLFHDELNPFYTPVYLQEFLDHAARHGLQHLAEAEGTRLRPAPPTTPRPASCWPGSRKAPPSGSSTWTTSPRAISGAPCCARPTGRWTARRTPLGSAAYTQPPCSGVTKPRRAGTSARPERPSGPRTPFSPPG
jgi:hypothetical protein